MQKARLKPSPQETASNESTVNDQNKALCEKILPRLA